MSSGIGVPSPELPWWLGKARHVWCARVEGLCVGVEEVLGEEGGEGRVSAANKDSISYENNNP